MFLVCRLDVVHIGIPRWQICLQCQLWDFVKKKYPSKTSHLLWPYYDEFMYKYDCKFNFQTIKSRNYATASVNHIDKTGKVEVTSDSRKNVTEIVLNCFYLALIK